MTVLFAQMKLLAIPLLSMPRFGFGGFGESYDESRAREQLVVLRPKDAPKVDWKNLDEWITDITSPVEGLFIMKVPTFKVSELGFFLLAIVLVGDGWLNQRTFTKT